MALKTMILPLCDACGEVFLPRKGPARDDPRGYNIRSMADRSLPRMRCGKCKSLGWDSKFVPDRRRKNPVFQEDHALSPEAKRALVAIKTRTARTTARKVARGSKSVTSAIGNGRRCKHRLYNCQLCSRGDPK